MNYTSDAYYYGGFQSYAIKPIASSKPGTGDYYQKDAYGQISDYNRRRIDFYDDKVRWNSNYDQEMIKTISESSYPQRSSAQTSRSEKINEDNRRSFLVEERRKNEEKVREQFIETKEERKKMFSNWTTTYQADCKQTTTSKQVQKSEIPDWLKKNYHSYHKATYKTDHSQGMGIHGDNPKDKFAFTNSQVDKLHFDNCDVAEGSTKMSNFIPGYAGHIAKDFQRTEDSALSDPFSKFGKTNHLLNYNLRMPKYSGYIPLNPKNNKGNTRPFCLSSQGETFS